jgi:predicted Zn-dependent protease
MIAPAMMKFVGLMLLWAIGGAWAIAALVFVFVAWTLDGIRLRALPQLFALHHRRQREGKLRTRLDVNPHDRPARFDLAEVLVQTKRGDEALALVEANIAAGDDDAEHRLLAGMAAALASPEDALDVALRHFDAAAAHSRDFRSGAIDLERGRALWMHAAHERAVSALEEALRKRPGSVEIRTMLAESLAALGRTDDAARMRAEAVTRFGEAPKFERRMQRRWGWRAAPMLRWRYIAGVTGASTAAALLVGAMLASCEPTSFDEEMPMPPPTGPR